MEKTGSNASVKSVRVSTKLFKSDEGLPKALGEKDFLKLSAPEQVGKLNKLFREHVMGDEKMSAQIMQMIRSATLFATTDRELTPEEIMKLSPYDMDIMTRLSRKKIALARFKIMLGAYYDTLSDDHKKELSLSGVDKEVYIKKSVHETYRQFSGVANEVIDQLWHSYGLSYDARFFLKTFNAEELESEDTLQEVCANNGSSSPEFFIDLEERLPFLGINGNKIRKELYYEVDEADRLTGNYLDASVSEHEDNHGIRNGFINPNWFLYDIDIDIALKLWGVEKTKYIFGRYFFEGIKQMDIADSLKMPEFYNFSTFRLKLNEDAEGNKKKLVDMAQHIFEWDLSSDFSQAKFAQLAKHLRSAISDLISSGEPKRFDHPIQTRLGAKKYTGYFSGSKGYENTHLIDIQPSDQKGKRVLRFATEMGQDTLLYVIIQTSYFLKNGTFLPVKKLWREIYAMYNQLSMEGVERFDPISLKSQYDLLVQKVVWPLSHEYKAEKGTVGTAHNTLLYGVYGTGKSQLLTHLLAERDYTLKNGKTIHLESNVINIGIMEFAELLVKSVSGFRKRLSDIHENTGLPIILVIEDIDTIVKESGSDSDPVSQAMTTLFEGVGSLPVTVIASTNYPEILPQRHLRPNRLDTILNFPYPLRPSEILSIFRTHWQRKGLDRILQHLDISSIEGEILRKIKNFTPSHISALALAIYEALEFEDVPALGIDDIKKIIATEIENCLVPVNDMNARESSMKRWRSALSTDGGGIGFTSDIKN